MRITQHMIHSSTLSNLQNNLSRIAKYQEQIETKNKINRPSDDPTGTSQTLSLQSNLNLNGQYQRNITNGVAWMDTGDSALNNFYKALTDARTSAIYGVNAVLEQSNYKALSDEVNALLDQLVTYSNTSLGNYYIFGGKNNYFAPFFRTGDNFIFSGDNGKILRDISPNGRFQVNVNGYNTFYKKLQALLKGHGSTVDKVDIESQQHKVTSFGTIDAAKLNGTLTLNVDGKDYSINFNKKFNAAAVTDINTIITNLDTLNGDIAIEIISDPTGSGATYQGYMAQQKDLLAKLDAYNINLEATPSSLGDGQINLSLDGNLILGDFGGTPATISQQDIEDRFSEQEVVNKINSILGLIGEASIDKTTGYLVIESKSTNMGKFISVTSADQGLQGLKLFDGFNNLQYGKYVVSTVNEASPANSKALVTDVYSQLKSTIVTNVGVADPANEYNSSILMEVVDVSFTNEYAELIGSGSVSTVFSDFNGKSIELVVDGESKTVTFSGVGSYQDIADQINEALGSQNAAKIDSNGILTIRSQTIGSDSTVVIKENSPSPGILGSLGMTHEQSGAVGVIDATVRFTYHTYDKNGERTDGVTTYTFRDLFDDNGNAIKDGRTDPAVVNIGGIDLDINLTGFVRAGDKAVISVTAKCEDTNDAITVNYSGQDRQYIFKQDAYKDAFNQGGDLLVDMKFFSIDVGNGEVYDGNIDLTFNSSGLGDATNAASFTAGNIFDMMVYLRKKLENMEVDKVEQMEFYFDEMMDVILQEQVKIGATTRQFEAVNMNYLHLEVNLGQMLSDYYDTDLPKTIVRLEEVMNAYQSSLYSTALISNAKLLDYLK